jgi:hypothetical protein
VVELLGVVEDDDAAEVDALVALLLDDELPALDDELPLVVDEEDENAPVSPPANWNCASVDGCSLVGVVATMSSLVVRPSPYMLPWFVPLKPV